MLLVKTYLDRSAIHGIGLFAAERLPKGAVLWRHSLDIDLLLTADQIAALHPAARVQIEKYSYLDRMLGKCGGTTVAARDIDAGEELTSDYASFDANHRGP